MGTVFAVGHFNNDGQLDVLAQRVDVDDDLIAIAGKGDGTFGEAGIVANTFRLHFARSADLDGDGNRDAVVVETAETSGGHGDHPYHSRPRGSDVRLLTAGLAVTSHSAAAATASFDDVRFDDGHP